MNSSILVCYLDCSGVSNECHALAGLVTGEKRANLAPEKKKKKNIKNHVCLTIKLECFIDKVKGTVADFRKSLKTPI